MRCKKCQHDKMTFSEVTFSNGTHHVEIKCAECKNHNGYMAQNLEGDQADYRMPFGKHKGMTLLEISRESPDYLAWAEKTFTGIIKKRLSIFLDSKPPTHISKIIPGVINNIPARGMEQKPGVLGDAFSAGREKA